MNYHFINQFNACGVPDVAGKENAAGVLSHPVTLPKIKVQYIGLLARFHEQAATKNMIIASSSQARNRKELYWKKR